MQTLTQPSLLLKPFAEQGDKNTLPITNTDPSKPQRADLTSGFPAIVSLLPDQGGLPPERKDFNALGYLTTSYDWFYQCGGTFTFDSTISTAIGGYPLGARLWYTNENGVSMIVRSTIQNNTNNFISDPTKIGRPGENKPWVIENFMGLDSPFPMFAVMWSDHEFNDASWLQANSWSWQDGTIYVSAYEYLEDEYTGGTQGSETVGSYTIQFTTGPSGIKIVTAANAGTVEDIYDESGIAWYYILDTTNQRFKLPRENPAREELIQVVMAKGNGITLGLTDGANNVGLGYSAGTQNPFFLQSDSAYGQNVGYTTTVASRANGVSFGVTSDPSKSGIVSNMTDSTSVYKGKQYLYFYVGNTIQNVTEVDVGEITEVLNKKWDSSNMQVISALPANPQTGVFYFIK